MKKTVVLALLGIGWLSVIGNAKASAFGSGNLVVVQVGTGSAALSSAATAGFLDEFSIGGSLVQQLALATAASGGQSALTFSGTATSEGQLIASANGAYFSVAGYNATPGTASVTSSTAAAVNRVIGVVNLNGTVDTSTAISTGTSGNPRSVVSDGSHFWLASSSAGVGYVSGIGSSSATQLSTTPSNTRVVGINAGQLYVDSASGTYYGIAAIGTGLPSTAGQTTTILSGFPTASGPSPYEFFFANSSTVYLADDRATGGIQKWTFDGATWGLAYTLSVEAGFGARSLTVDTSGANAVIYATTTESSANKIVSIVDTGAGATATVIATAAANTVFRGIGMTPVPEPSTMALAAIGGLAGLLVLRRKH